jgi:sporulation protein YlmC with PRC-barrel domain
MVSNQTTIKWSDLYNLDVIVPSDGKSLGKVEDFFFKEGTNAVYALCVRTRLHGNLSLPVTGIVAVEKDRVAIRNPQMLAKALPPLGRGQQLVSRKVIGSKGSELGTIKDVVINIDPPATMHLAGFEMLQGSSSRNFNAAIVSHYNNEDNSVVIYDQSTKKMR